MHKNKLYTASMGVHSMYLTSMSNNVVFVHYTLYFSYGVFFVNVFMGRKQSCNPAWSRTFQSSPLCHWMQSSGRYRIICDSSRVQGNVTGNVVFPLQDRVEFRNFKGNSALSSVKVPRNAFLSFFFFAVVVERLKSDGSN